jgi:anti-anti-sigma factor
MQLKTRQLQDGIAVIELNGRMDGGGVQEIDDAFTAAVQGPGRIVVDLSGVSFIASQGIRALLTHAREVARAGGRVVLAGPQPRVREILGYAGADSILTVCEDAAAAAEKLRRG